MKFPRDTTHPSEVWVGQLVLYKHSYHESIFVTQNCYSWIQICCLILNIITYILRPKIVYQRAINRTHVVLKYTLYKVRVYQEMNETGIQGCVCSYMNSFYDVYKMVNWMKMLFTFCKFDHAFHSTIIAM